MVTTQGWYPDPWQAHEHRWWDGARWTNWVLDPTATTAAPPVASVHEPTSAPAGEERRAIATFLDREVAQGAISYVVHRRLMDDLLAPATTAVAAAYPPPGTAPSPAPVGVPGTAAAPLPPPPAPLPPPPAPWAPAFPVQPRSAPLPPPPSRPPTTPSSTWPGPRTPRPRTPRVRPAITTDLAVHGLAYAGVALVLTGVIGFVIFAFGDVGSGWRPLAELAIVSVLLGSGAFLRRRGAPFVGDALVLLGGLVTPVLVVTAFVDGAPVPPDLSARSLAFVLTPVFLAVAGAFALAVRRRPGSPLRFLVAPMVWWAAAAAGLIFVSGSPVARDIATPAAGQWALVALAVAATTWAARLRPATVLARPSLIAAYVGGPLAEVVVLLAARAAGWPLLPVVVAGLATIATIEALAEHRPSEAVLAQAAVAVVTGLAAAATLGPEAAAAGIALALVALAEWGFHREADPGISSLCLGGAGVASLATFGQPATALTVALLLLAWSVARSWKRVEAMPLALPLVGTFGYPLLAAVALGQLHGVGWAAVALAAAAVAATPVARARRRAHDTIGIAWVLTQAGVAVTLALAIGSMSSPTDGELVLGAVTLALGALAVGRLPGWPIVRLWAVAALISVSAAELGVTAGLSLTTGAVLGAGVAMLLVVLGQVPRIPDDGHLAVIGHLGGAVAVVAAVVAAAEGLGPSIRAADLATGWTATAFIAAAVGWAVSTAVGEWRGSRERNLWIRLIDDVTADQPAEHRWWAPGTEVRHEQLGSLVAPLATLVLWSGVPSVVLLATGVLADEDPWLGVTVGAVGLFAVLGAGTLVATRRRLARCWAIGIWFAAAAVPFTTGSQWALFTATVLVVAAAVAVEPHLGNLVTVTAGWLASAVAAVSLAAGLGLDPDHLYFVVFAWGAPVLLGTLVLDDRLAGRRSVPGPVIRRTGLWPPFVLGAAAALFSLSPSAAEPLGTFGWSALAFTVVAFAAAGLLRRAWVSILGWSGAVATVLALAPWETWTRPWQYVPLAIALLVAAEAAGRLAQPPAGERPALDLDRRWDLPPFVLAQAILVWSLAASGTVGWMPATWLAVAATWAVIGVRLRSGWWFLAAVPVALVGAGALGPGWLTLALALTTVAAAVEATRSEDARLVLQLTTGFAGSATLASCIVWREWGTEATSIALAAAGALVLAGLAVGVRWARLRQDWLATLVTFPVGAVLGATALAFSADVAPTPARLTAAGALAVAAGAAGILAHPTGWSALRETSAVVLVGAAVVAGSGLSLTPTAIVLWSVSASLFAGLGAAVLHESEARVWSRPALIGSGLLLVIGLGGAAEQLPDRPLMVLVLVTLGVELLGIGLFTRHTGWLMAAPVAFLAAWLTYASDALTGDAQWFTAPTALTVLVMVGVVRWSRRRDGVDPRLPELSVTELLAMALLVAPSVVETVTRSPGFGLVAVALGLGLVSWGVITRVRRRLLAGVTTATLALLLMVVPPALDLVPPLEGSVPWILLAGLGLAALLTAAFLEKGRQMVRHTIRSFREATNGWE